MPSQPPTQDQIRAAILGVLPSWLKEPDEVIGAQIDAVAAIFARLHLAFQTLSDRTLIDLADGTWLDAHGSERSKVRRPEESDEDFRARIRVIDDKLTPPAIEAAVNAVLITGSATVVDHPLSDPTFTPPAGTTLFSLGFIGRSNSVLCDRVYTLVLPDQSPQARNTAFTSEISTFYPTTSFSWDQETAGPAPRPGMYTADVDGARGASIYARIIEILDDLTAAGVQARPIISA